MPLAAPDRMSGSSMIARPPISADSSRASSTPSSTARSPLGEPSMQTRIRWIMAGRTIAPSLTDASHPAVERGQIDPQHLGGARLVSAFFRQDGGDVTILELAQRHRRAPQGGGPPP